MKRGTHLKKGALVKLVGARLDPKRAMIVLGPGAMPDWIEVQFPDGRRAEYPKTNLVRWPMPKRGWSL